MDQNLSKKIILELYKNRNEIDIDLSNSDIDKKIIFSYKLKEFTMIKNFFVFFGEYTLKYKVEHKYKKYQTIVKPSCCDTWYYEMIELEQLWKYLQKKAFGLSFFEIQ
jgi:hypothetical protein